MKPRPCPKCNGTDIKTHDCGYNTFNPGWAICACGHRVDVSGCENSNDPCIIAAWNAVPVGEKLKSERLKTRKLRKQVRDMGVQPVV